MTKKFLSILLLISASSLLAQQVTYDRVKKEYDSFEYENVIKLSDELIKSGTLSDSLLIDVYLMRAVSFYSLGDENSTKENFKEILKIKNDYSADPSQISPKLIALFNQVKIDFSKTLKPEVTKTDSLQQISTLKYFDYNLAKNSFIRNIFLPGLGQFYSGLKTKGTILGLASVLNLAGIIFYVNDTNKKENDYLNEIDPIIIQQKYDLFNKSYKIRNTLLISYVVIWIYSQLDLLFFNDNEIFMKEIAEPPSISYKGIKQSLQLNFRIPF